MSLLDIAAKIRTDADAARKATEEEERRAAARVRNISYYKQFGDEWFSEIAKHMEGLSQSFNEIAGTELTLKARLNATELPHSIEIELAPHNNAGIAASPRCLVMQKRETLKAILEFSVASNVSSLECDVRIHEFKAFRVQVVLKSENQVIDEAATDRYCNVEDEHFFPIFKTVKSEEKKNLSTGEFADFVLTHFVKLAKRKR